MNQVVKTGAWIRLPMYNCYFICDVKEIGNVYVMTGHRHYKSYRGPIFEDEAAGVHAVLMPSATFINLEYPGIEIFVVRKSDLISVNWEETRGI